jgi:very-short-patch-repair endonuclease
MSGKKHNVDAKKKISLASSGSNNGFYGKKHTALSISKILATQLKRWKANPNLRNKQNKVEKVLENLLNELFPNEYKFTGDCKFFIEKFNPDFINCNGQKKIIELYGDYWHSKPDYIKRDKDRLKTYSNYGYKTLIVKDYELKDLEKAKQKLLEFHTGV